jgi:hypothetical protein
MKRTSRQGGTNNNEQTRCEFHRVIKLIKAVIFNQQIDNNLNILYR